MSVMTRTIVSNLPYLMLLRRAKLYASLEQGLLTRNVVREPHISA